MGTTRRRLATLVGPWLLCGAGGALLCLVAAVVVVGANRPAAWVAYAVWGFEWGLVGGAVLGGLLWAHERGSRGLRPGEGLLVAIVMGALCALVFVQFRLGLLNWQVLRPPLPIPPRSDAFGPWSMALWAITPALAALGGMVAAALQWGWPGRRRSAAGWRTAAAALAALGAVYLLWPEWSPLFAPTREFARGSACESQLKGLGRALQMYAESWDGRLPLCKTANGLAGVRHDLLDNIRAHGSPRGSPPRPWRVLGGGPLQDSLRNATMYFCPSDPANCDWRGHLIIDRFPEPGISYAWNAKWAGKRLQQVPADEWLLRDRGPWHNGGWYVVRGDGRVEWQRP